MTFYSCLICGLQSSTKQVIINHLKRKKPCTPVNTEVEHDRALLIKELTKRTYRDDCVECQFCERKFNLKSSLYRHQKVCKKSPERDLLKKVEEMQASRHEDLKKFDAMKTMLEHLEAKINNTTTNSYNNNTVINNTQVINGFGQEDTSHLTSQFLDRCVKKTNMGLIDLLDKLHFGAGHGRNANVRITNRKLPLAEVNDGNQWKFVKKDKAINDMVDRGQDILQEHLDEHQERIKEQLSTSMWLHIQEYFERMEVRDDATIRDIIDDVYIMLLNKTRELSSV